MADLDSTSMQYLVDHEIEKLFEALTESLILEKPSDPKAYLSSVLSHQSTLNYQDLCHILECFKQVSTLSSPYAASLKTIDSVCSLLHCERASIFLHDRFHNTLKMVVGKSAKGLVLSSTTGFTWSVFLDSKTKLMQDAYSDPDFDASIDLATGFKTRNMLGSPIKDFEGNTIGVVLALNKLTGNFLHKDERIIEQLAHLAGIFIKNSINHTKSSKNDKKVRALLKFLKQVLRDKPGQSLAIELVDKAKDLLQAETCSIFMVDHINDSLIPIASDSLTNYSFNTHTKIWKDFVKNGEIISTDNKDPRFESDFNEYLLGGTETVLVVPILNEKRVIGFVVVTNKFSDSMFGDLKMYARFDEDDSELLQTFGEILSKKLEKLFLSCVKGEKVDQETVGFKSGFGLGKGKDKELPEGAIKESNEEEEGNS